MSVQIRKGNIHIGQKPVVIEKDFLVRFFDYDGTILKEQWVYSGETATAPDVPNHQYLTFAEWNNDLTNIDSDIDAGAIYNTTDDKTYLFITLTPTLPSGTTVSLSLTKSTTSVATIDWGDGTTSTTTTVGHQLIPHTYSTYGDYIVTVSNLLGGYCRLGSEYQVFAYGPFPLTPNIVNKIYFGNGTANSSGYALLYNNKSCSFVSFSVGFIICALFGQKSVLKHINLSRLSFLNQNMITDNFNIKYVTCSINANGYNGYQFYFPRSILSLPRFSGSTISIQAAHNLKYSKWYSPQTSMSSLSNCFSLEIADFPSTITSVSSYAFDDCYNLKHVIFRSDIPPTIGTTIFPDLTSNIKIYVPDNVVDVYKTATGWISYANYIYPLSTYVHYRPDLK